MAFVSCLQSTIKVDKSQVHQPAREDWEQHSHQPVEASKEAHASRQPVQGYKKPHLTMGDSDDEYDRRRGRDKFRRERNDYERRDDRRPGREGWEDRLGLAH